MKRSIKIVAAAALAAAVAAQAAETITYSYDAKGRLKQVARSGSVNNGVQAQYTHDKANNRKSIVVAGSPNPPP